MNDQNSERRRYQVSLKTLLIVVFLCTVLLAALTPLWRRVGPFGAVVILGSALVIVGPPVAFLVAWLAFWTVLLRLVEWLERGK